MTETIISPSGHSPKGKIPRNLLPAGLLLVFGAAAAYYWFNAEEPSKQTSDQAVQAKLQEGPTDGNVGNPQSVDEAAARADEARKKEQREQAERLAKAAADKAKQDQRPAQPGQPLPADVAAQAGIPPSMNPNARPTAAQGGVAMEPGAAAREVARRDQDSLVFDGTSGETLGSAVGAAAGAVAGAPGTDMPSLAQVLGNAGGGTDAMSNALLEVAKAQGAGAGKADSRQAAQMKWLESQQNATTKNDALTPQPPVGQYVLRQGKWIESVLTREITSEAEGVVTARSTRDTYDAAGNMLFPKGTEFVGRYNSNVSFGQSRMMAAFSRMTLPNGYFINLPGAEVSDAMGRGGIAGDVDRHYVQSFGSALLLGWLADRVTQANKLPATQVGVSTSSSGLSATGQVFVDTARTELERAKGIAPTITVAAGSRINIEVVRDMVFPGPYNKWSKK